MPAIRNHEALTTGCCIAGGGPAGMMLGFLLARVGVEVVVLEKHPDFLRDFRGDTIHPSTLEVIRELGLLDEFLKLPHEKARRLSGVIGDELVQLADFTYLRTGCRFIAMMPQWDFLNFLGSKNPEQYLTKEQQKACLDSAAAELIREISQRQSLN
jgi:2-polyprenyl-6-methoxyphenol hydroxylase-like FAD-dependent oxidoreductase